MIGQTISHYKILEKLGGGGMGVVYKAQDIRLDRAVALKFLPPDLTRDPEARERFIHEAKAASALQHDNICTVHDIDETTDGQMFICMDFYEGETLKKKIERGPLPIDAAIDLSMQVARGLEKAHEAGMVHRDIKPANIMVTKDGEVKIVDFGLAKLTGMSKLTRQGSTLGTAAYMSPEQAHGEEIDRRSDIWSLGIVLYEMIAGRPPFKAEYENALMYSILNTEPEPVTALRTGVPMDLERIIKKCMAKDLTVRYQHVDDLLADLTLVERTVENAPAARGTPEPKRRRALLYAMLAVVIIAGAIAALFLLVPTAEVLDSIAVLPLENRSGDPQQEYFCDGISDALITELQKIKSLRIISWTSARQFKKTTKTLPEIANELNVKAVVEGAVSREGDTVRVIVQLVQASPEKHLWASIFDRNLKNVLALQSDVARAIAQEIRVTITQEEQKRLITTRQVDPGAYEMYLKGRHHWNKRTAEDLTRAVEYFNQAIEMDPGYALAYAGLAQTYIIFPEYVGLPGKEYFPKAEAAAKRALELDETLAEAHSVLGLRNQYAYDWAGAERELRKAIELNSNYPTAHHWYGLLLRTLGRLEEAMAEVKRARELDPLSLAINAVTARPLHSMRRYDEAIEQYKKTLELDQNYAPGHSFLGDTYCLKGMFAEAIAEYEKVRSRAESSRYRLGNLGYAYAKFGKTGEAELILGQLIELSKQGYVTSYGIALVYNGLDRTNEALRWLEAAYEDHDRWIVEVKVDPLLDNLRSEPRFKALLQKMGLEK